jgi:hypothetical protein
MHKLVQIPPVAAPRKFGWLVPGHNCTQLAYDLLMRADLDIGILEVPNGSNRGTRIDAMAKRAGFPPPADPKREGPYWCAIWAGCVAADMGLLVPQGFAATDNWLPYVKEGRWDAKPAPGDFVLYGLKKKGPAVTWGDAHHIGIVARVPEPALGQLVTMTIEGNRSLAGTASNNGIAVDIGPMTRRDILGYVSPERLRAA